MSLEFVTVGSFRFRRLLTKSYRSCAFQRIYNVARSNTTVKVEPQNPKGEPCLSVIDYVGWAVQRAYESGDMKYYRLIEDKIGIIIELEAGKKPW